MKSLIVKGKYKVKVVKKNANLRRLVHCSVIYSSQVMEATNNKLMDKEGIVYIHNGILIIRKRKLCHQHAAWMNIEGIMLSKMRQERMDFKNYITYMWNMKKQRKEDNKTETGILIQRAYPWFPQRDR